MIQFFVKKKSNANGNLQQNGKLLAVAAPSKTTFYKWSVEFKRGRMKTDDSRNRAQKVQQLHIQHPSYKRFNLIGVQRQYREVL